MSAYGSHEPLEEGNANFGRKKNLVIACFIKSPEMAKYSNSQQAAENLNTEFKIQSVWESRHRNPSTEGMAQSRAQGHLQCWRTSGRTRCKKVRGQRRGCKERTKLS